MQYRKYIYREFQAGPRRLQTSRKLQSLLDAAFPLMAAGSWFIISADPYLDLSRIIFVGKETIELTREAVQRAGFSYLKL